MQQALPQHPSQTQDQPRRSPQLQEQPGSARAHSKPKRMPLSQPCTTQECREAAVAAMRAQRGDNGLEGASSGSAGATPHGLWSPPGSGTSAGVESPRGSGRMSLPPGICLVSPPGTPARGGAPQPNSALKAAAAEPSPAASPARTVRFSDAERDNLHVGIQADSRSSSVDSPHKAYDAVLAGEKASPASESGFHVVRTAGGRLDAVSSSARWEDVVGYSRAVKRGPFIYVSGTSAVDQASGRVMYRRDAYKQTRLAFTIVERALAQVGASMEDVVRTRLFVRHLQRDGEGISRAHGEVLGHVKPASTMVEVARMVHEDILVLIEVDAVLGDLP